MAGIALKGQCDLVSIMVPQRCHSFIAQLNELGISKRIKNIFNKFQKGISYKKVGEPWPPFVGGAERSYSNVTCNSYYMSFSFQGLI